MKMKRIKAKPLYQKDKPEEKPMNPADLPRYEWRYTNTSSATERYENNYSFGIDPMPLVPEDQNNELNIQFIDAIGNNGPVGTPGQVGDQGLRGDTETPRLKAPKFIDTEPQRIFDDELSKTRYNFKPSFATITRKALDLNEDVIKKEKVYYPKPDTEEEYSDRDRDIEDDNIYRKEQDDYKMYQEQKKVFILNYFTLYRETKNEIYLMKVLLTHFYHILENGYAFNTLKAKYREYTQKNITSFIKKDISYFLDNLVRECGLKHTDVTDLIPIIEEILNNIYNFTINPQESKALFIDINNNDCFFEIINTAKERGVKLDPEFLNLNINFKELRSKYRSMTIVYVLPLNQLILFSSDNGNLVEPKSRVYNTFLNYVNSKYPLISLKENVDVVVINGKEYSKEAFESITESNLDNFLSILEVESLIMAEEVSDVADHEF